MKRGQKGGKVEDRVSDRCRIGLVIAAYADLLDQEITGDDRAPWQPARASMSAVSPYLRM